MSKGKSGRKGRKKKVTCKKCGFGESVSDFGNPQKTWNLVSPMPDKDGNVTMTVMGSFRCPKCNASIKAVVQKVKGDQFGGGKSKKQLLIELASSCTEAISLDHLAEKIGLSRESVEKALSTLLKKGALKGKVSYGSYFP